MFDMGGGRQIEDRAKERRIEYIDRGLGMVNFYIEMEGGRMKEKNSQTILQILILVMNYFTPFRISFFICLFMKLCSIKQIFFNTCDK